MWLHFPLCCNQRDQVCILHAHANALTFFFLIYPPYYSLCHPSLPPTQAILPTRHQLTHPHTFTCTDTRMHLHARTHSHTHAHITHAPKLTHTIHTHTLSLSLFLSLSLHPHLQPPKGVRDKWLAKTEPHVTTLSATVCGH